MMLRGLCLRSTFRSFEPFTRNVKRHKSLKSTRIQETDSCGIPLRPTWSVNELLSSYPTPTISPSTLKRLCELSALIPPSEGTAAYAELKKEMEELVRLVEAVKLIDVKVNEDEHNIPDGRIWAEGTGIDLAKSSGLVDEGESRGTALLKHASRTEDGFYVVDAQRTRQ